MFRPVPIGNIPNGQIGRNSPDSVINVYTRNIENIELALIDLEDALQDVIEENELELIQLATITSLICLNLPISFITFESKNLSCLITGSYITISIPLALMRFIMP